MENTTSKPGTMSSANWKAFGKGILIAGAGALIAYLPNFDFSTLGNWGPILGGVGAILVNFLRLWLGKQES